MIYLTLRQYLRSEVRDAFGKAFAPSDTRTDKEYQFNAGRLDMAQMILAEVERHGVYNWNIDGIVDRLRKASAKSTQAVVRDQIRLAIRQLDALREPADAYTEPIDIFEV